MNLHNLKYLETKILGKHSSTYCYNKPNRVVLSVNKNCNLNCVWCQRSLNKNIKDVRLDYDQGLSIVNSLPSNTNFIICSFGEPLLYPLKYIYDYIQVASEKNIYTSITSNGMLLTKDVSKALKDNGLNDIHISIDSPYPNMFSKIRTGGNLELIKNNLKNSDLDIYINWVICEETKNSYKDMVKLAVDVNAKGIHVQNLREWNGPYHYVKDTNYNRYLQAVIYQECIDNNLETDILKTLFHKNKGSCFQLFEVLHINSNGFVTPCCGWDNHNLIKCYDVMKCWNSEPVRKFRKLMLYKKYPSFCRKRCFELSG